MDGDAAEIVEGTVADLGNLERWWTESSIAVWSCAFFLCFLLNATLLLAFLIRPGLRTISNRFVMNLTVSNLFFCVLLNPLLIVDASSSSSSSQTTTSSLSLASICVISEGATALVTTSSVLSVLLIAIDQYFAVVDPLRYRARVDKLKSGVLILSIWLISTIFAILATFNPNPRSFWLSCDFQRSPVDDLSEESDALDSKVHPNFAILHNGTNISDTYGAEMERRTAAAAAAALLETIDVEESVKYEKVQNSTFQQFVQQDSIDDSFAYGTIYAVVHFAFAYLLPFSCVCWIYVSIYSAAHRNSERTRRTGSRPILSSSASFCEDQRQQQQLQQYHEVVTVEDFRRIPKISSLSSIDETSETTQPAISQAPRRRSFGSSASEIVPCNLPMDEAPSSVVVFTVGEKKLDVCSSERHEEEALGEEEEDEEVGEEGQVEQQGEVEEEERGNESKEAALENVVPICTLRREEFFVEREKAPSVTTTYENLVKSGFLDRSEEEGTNSSRNSIYQEIFENARNSSWIREISSDASGTDSGEENCQMNGENLTISHEHFLSPFSEYEKRMSEKMKEKRRKNREIRQNSKEHFQRSDSLCQMERAEEEEVEEVEEVEEGEEGEEGEEEGNDRKESETMERGLVYKKELISIKEAKEREECTDLQLTNVIVDSRQSSVVEVAANRSYRTSSTTDGACAVETSPCLLTPIVTITPAPTKTSLHRVSSVKSTSSYINSLKHRISNGSLFRYREETRAARISALVIVMGLLCWSPYEVLLLLKNLPPYKNESLSHEYDVAALSFLLAAAYASPLLFGYRSKRVKRELRKFFCFRKELSYKNNRSLMAKKVLRRRHSSTFSHLEMDNRYNIFNCVYGRNRWPKEKVQFVQVPDTALAVETCRSSFSSGASTQISSTSTEDC